MRPERVRPGRPRISRALAALAVLAVLAGCSSGSQSSGSGSEAAGVAAEPAPLQDGGAANLDSQGQAAPAIVTAEGLTDRDLVRTADVRVRVDDVVPAVERLRSLATTYDGFVGGESTELADQGSATITLRVPTDRLDALLADVEALGVVQRRDVRVDDVTDTRVDVETRLANQQASVDRLRTLLAQASSVPDVVTVETQLVQREAELESLQARSRVLSQQVALATATVSLEATTPPAATDQEPGDGIVDAFAGGVGALGDTVHLALRVLAAVTPFLLVLAPVVVVGVLVARRRRAAVRPAAGD